MLYGSKIIHECLPTVLVHRDIEKEISNRNSEHIALWCSITRAEILKDHLSREIIVSNSKTGDVLQRIVFFWNKKLQTVDSKEKTINE